MTDNDFLARAGFARCASGRMTGSRKRPIPALALAAFAACFGLHPLSAFAQALPQQEMEDTGEASSGDWNITLGGGVGGNPIYPGAERYHAEPFFLGSISYRNFSFIGPEGLGANLVNTGGFRFGPVFGYQGGRHEGSDPHLAGLGNIQVAITAGAFAAYDFDDFELRATLRQAVVHSNNGVIGRLELDYRHPIANKLDFEIGPEMDYGDGRYMKTWFGVSPAQAAHSALPVYNPEGGISDTGVHVIFNYHYSEKILLRAFGDARMFVGDASDSPIVESRTQLFVGLGGAYQFGLGD